MVPATGCTLDSSTLIPKQRRALTVEEGPHVQDFSWNFTQPL